VEGVHFHFVGWDNEGAHQLLPPSSSFAFVFVDYEMKSYLDLLIALLDRVLSFEEGDLWEEVSISI
jgi:hypothetical protein